ncbi:hypothetical protein GIB67_038082 [Kingdonia uniflora]|uniref:Uncharacterized protein n=1 Tax=Kingdonia uniflora TaxID=39325 RepID=A0A7J7N5S8_9MAGN|nr:hypothetical protein GIB67_034135 [Kingdonia uniflora]KAF6162496.1 hypothetical protein GIB67_038082 [Kingdonia uniflora]
MRFLTADRDPLLEEPVEYLVERALSAVLYRAEVRSSNNVRELETTKDAGSGLSKASWAKIKEEYNVKFHLTRGPKYFSNVWFCQRAKYNAWTWLLRRTRNGHNAETCTFHLPSEEWDALIKINENISMFRKGGLPHEDLIEVIFASIFATGQYATGPARDNFIDTATLDVAAGFNIEDENNVPINLTKGDTDTYFTDHHFESSEDLFCSWSQVEPSISQLE